jgi:hypothetical protein
MGGMSSLTGGGGLSSSSAAESGTGEQSGGGFVVGNFFGAGTQMSIQAKQTLIAAGVVASLALFYAIRKK